MKIRVKLNNKSVNVDVSSEDCKYYKCLSPHIYQHRNYNATEGSMITNDKHYSCSHRNYHGCPDKPELRNTRKGWLIAEKDECVKIHELKIDPESLRLIKDGVKTCEVRFDDRGFKTGDHLVLRETKYSYQDMRDGHRLIYTNRQLNAIITHIDDVPGIEYGWCVLSIRLLG